MRRSLFRVEALKSKQISPLGKVVLIQPISFYLLTVCAVLSAVTILIFSYFIEYSKRIQVAGILLPQKGLIKIQSPRPGIVIERRVREGQHVSAGDVLYVLSGEIMSSDPKKPGEKKAISTAILDALSAQHDSMKKERAKLPETYGLQYGHLLRRKSNLDLELQKVDQEIALQIKRIDSAALQQQRYLKLEAQGYLSPLASQQKNDDVLDQQSRLENIRRGRLSLIREIADAGNELTLLASKSTRERAEYDRKIFELDQTSAAAQSASRILITAPQSGTVAAVLVESGQMINNQTMLTVLPENSELEAQLFVPGTAVGFVKIGDKLSLRIAAYPYLKFGKIEGRVMEVSQTSISPQEMPGQLNPMKRSALDSNGEAMFRVKVAMNKQTFSINGTPRPMLSGMEFDTEIVQERRSLLGWILEPLYRFKESL